MTFVEPRGAAGRPVGASRKPPEASGGRPVLPKPQNRSGKRTAMRRPHLAHQHPWWQPAKLSSFTQSSDSRRSVLNFRRFSTFLRKKIPYYINTVCVTLEFYHFTRFFKTSSAFSRTTLQQGESTTSRRRDIPAWPCVIGKLFCEWPTVSSTSSTAS